MKKDKIDHFLSGLMMNGCTGADYNCFITDIILLDSVLFYHLSLLIDINSFSVFGGWVKIFSFPQIKRAHIN